MIKIEKKCPTLNDILCSLRVSQRFKLTHKNSSNFKRAIGPEHIVATGFNPW